MARRQPASVVRPTVLYISIPGFPFSHPGHSKCTPVAVRRVRFSSTLAPAPAQRAVRRCCRPGQTENCRVFMIFLTHLSVPASFLRQILGRSTSRSTPLAGAVPQSSVPLPRTAASSNDPLPTGATKSGNAIRQPQTKCLLFGVIGHYFAAAKLSPDACARRGGAGKSGPVPPRGNSYRVGPLPEGGMFGKWGNTDGDDRIRRPRRCQQARFAALPRDG